MLASFTHEIWFGDVPINLYAWVILFMDASMGNYENSKIQGLMVMENLPTNVNLLLIDHKLCV